MMLLDLFSTVDFTIFKAKILSIYIVWFIGVFWMFFFFNFFFLKKKFFSLYNFMSLKHYFKVKMNMLNMLKFSYLFFFSIFIMIFFSNMCGVVPYMFGITTQMVVSLSLSLKLWLCVFLSKVIFNLKSFSSHITPEGSPLLLVVPLKKIELFSNFMRPITLSLRLSIKMTTGHMFFVLLTSGMLSLCLKNNLCFIVFFLISFFYFFFELGICLLQGFVFSLLGVQYMDEHNLF